MQTQEYRARLETMLVDITSELKTVGIHNPENPSDWIAVPEEFDAEEPDQNLAADAVEAWDERNGLVTVLESKYNSIKDALVRIDAGTFGTCEICQAPIEEKRLMVSPTARTCMTHLEDESQIAS
ncbi:TraR/DksA C4-type zinc finger protein [Candidatus Kaiserbacteria bacterium]|nr:MAG: TraR/DksA C4-type zinc finger protein [Candidatus Kaiserbacteria bacterium]